MNAPNLPLPMAPAPDPRETELAPLLDEPFARAWAVPGAAAPAAVRGRLFARLAASAAASRPMATARRARVPAEPLAAGVRAQQLYAAAPGRPPRPGEPQRARLVELDPGSTWAGPAPDLHREWLVLRGVVETAGETLALRDYRVEPAGAPARPWHSAGGALLFLREAALPAAPGDAPRTVRDADAGWPDFAPGIRRRVLWQRDGQAALLYHAEPGAQVPQHSHGHDEECLMVQGELFLDDVLLQPGDYQLAPAGTGHRITETDTGVVIYAHGDLDLRFVA